MFTAVLQKVDAVQSPWNCTEFNSSLRQLSQKAETKKYYLYIVHIIVVFLCFSSFFVGSLTVFDAQKKNIPDLSQQGREPGLTSKSKLQATDSLLCRGDKTFDVEAFLVKCSPKISLDARRFAEKKSLI